MSQCFAITCTNKIQMAFDKLSLAFIIVIVPVIIIPNTVLFFQANQKITIVESNASGKAFFCVQKELQNSKGTCIYMLI